MLAASVGLHGKVILLAGGETADREVVDTVDVLTIDGALNSSTMFKPSALRLSQARSGLAGVASQLRSSFPRAIPEVNGDEIIFAGGSGTAGWSDKVIQRTARTIAKLMRS